MGGLTEHTMPMHVHNLKQTREGGSHLLSVERIHELAARRAARQHEPPAAEPSELDRAEIAEMVTQYQRRRISMTGAA